MNESIAWAAGLFEGEGCITQASRGNPLVLMKMTDPDVIEQFALIMDNHGVIGSINGPYQGKNKPFWKWQSSGYINLELVYQLFHRWLGERRRERFEEILASKPEKVRRMRRRNIPDRLVAKKA